MGEVIQFRARKLSGFIPDEIGQMAMEYLNQQHRARDLVLFAKRGAPAIIGPVEFDPNDRTDTPTVSVATIRHLHPDDCA